MLNFLYYIIDFTLLHPFFTGFCSTYKKTVRSVITLRTDIFCLYF